MAAIERPFVWIARRAIEVSEHAQGVDSIFLRIGKLLLWPLLAVGRLLSWLAAAILPESVREVLGAPFRWAGRIYDAVQGGFWKAVEGLNLDGLVHWIVWLLIPVWRPIAAVGGFLIAWLNTRNYRLLLWGLPAFLLACPLTAAVGWRWMRGPGIIQEKYDVAAKRAFADNDFVAGAFYSRKLEDLGVDTKMNDFRRAEALQKDGKIDEAYQIMKTLAPLDGSIFPSNATANAHAWIFQHIFSGQVKIPQEEGLEITGKHLDALEIMRVDPQWRKMIRLWRGQWFFAKGKHAEAVKLLKPLALEDPQAAYYCLQMFLKDQDFPQAREMAKIIHDQAMKVRQSGKPVPLDQCRLWVMAEQILQDDDLLVEALQAWLKYDGANEQARTLLAESYRRQFDRMLRAAAPSRDQLAELLSNAARHPASRSWAEQNIGLLMANYGNSELAKEVVEKLIATTDTPPVLIEALGTWRALQGDHVRSRELLKRSLDADSGNAIAWNNYAWALGESGDAAIDEALAAVNKAIQLSPDEYRFKETRGQLYVRLKRWKEAVEDLEIASNGMPEAPSIHASLAKAYDALGDKQLAEIHRLQVKQ